MFSTPPVVERQTFVVSSPAIALNALNKSMLSVFNGLGSGRVLKLQNILILNSQTAAIVGNVVQFDLLRTSAQAGGTAVTAIGYDSANLLPAQITAATGATVTDVSALPLRSWFLGGDEIAVGAATNQGVDRANMQIKPTYHVPTSAGTATALICKPSPGRAVGSCIAGAERFGAIFTIE